MRKKREYGKGRHRPQGGCRLEVKLNPDEKAEVRGWAAARGVEMSTFVRGLFAEYRKRRSS